MDIIHYPVPYLFFFGADEIRDRYAWIEYIKQLTTTTVMVICPFQHWSL